LGYLDESGTDNSGPVKCSAGYLFEPDGAESFDREWALFLADRGLECFHAKEIFHRRKDQKEIFAALVALVKRTAHKGFVRFMQGDTSVQPNMRRATGSDYSLCTLSCMEVMAGFAKKHDRRIICVIEGGNEYEGELLHFLSLIKKGPSANLTLCNGGG
jgi:hypothetical protein